MADDKSHFLIPPGNIRSAKYEKHGGGVNYERNDHTRHGIKLREQTSRVREIELAKKDSKFISDFFVQIETPSNTSIKNYKSNIEKLGFEIISYRSEKPSIGIAKIKKKKFDDIGQKLKEYIESDSNRGKSYFSPIDTFSSIPVESKIDSSIKGSRSKEKISVVFNLYSALTGREKFPVNQAIVNELIKVSSDVVQSSFSNGTTSISCTLDSDKISAVAEQFSSIKDVKLDENAFVENAIDTQELPKSLKIQVPKSKSSICVIDSGIKDGGGVFSGIISDTMEYLPKGAVESHYVHGTFVASRCVFGDNIDACLGTNILSPYCRVIDVRTFGIDSSGRKVNPRDSHLRRIIETVVIKLHKTVKVYNLSFGFDSSIKDHEYSELAKLLDFLSKEYKVLFVIASGNITSLLGKYPTQHFRSPSARIGSPAESILSLTVGAISKHADSNSLSKQGELSPFSKIGPGADLGLKPELVAHGGNLIVKYDRSPRVSTYGISPDGKSLAVDVGTSFSAPLIAQYAQRLFDIYPGSDVNLVKALLCHFSVNKSLPFGTANPTRHCTGLGEPAIESAILAGPHNAAFIFEGSLDQENYQYIAFHIPKSLAQDNRNSRLKIKVTLVYDPKVDVDNPAEYSQSRVSLFIEKPGAKKKAIIGFDSNSGYSNPWSPIMRFEKTFSRNYLTGQWELRLRLYTRGKLQVNYKQDYAVVIEIIDEKKSADVYNDLREEFGKIYRKIKIRAAA